MYFDQKILSIIYEVKPDSEEMDEIMDQYNEAMFDLTYEVFKAYMLNKNYEKPKVKGIMDLVEAGEIENLPKIEATRLYTNALRALVTYPTFREVLKKAMDAFNEDLLIEKLSGLDKTATEEINNYLDTLAQNAEKNESEFEKLLDQIEKQNPDFFEYEDEPTNESNTQTEDTPVETQQTTQESQQPEPQQEQIQSTATEPKLDNLNLATPEEVDMQPVMTPQQQDTQPDVEQTQPDQEPTAPQPVQTIQANSSPDSSAPQKPPTEDLPERKVSVGNEPEEPEPVSFAR